MDLASPAVSGTSVYANGLNQVECKSETHTTDQNAISCGQGSCIGSFLWFQKKMLCLFSLFSIIRIQTFFLVPWDVDFAAAFFSDHKILTLLFRFRARMLKNSSFQAVYGSFSFFSRLLQFIRYKFPQGPPRAIICLGFVIHYYVIICISLLFSFLFFVSSL